MLLDLVPSGELAEPLAKGLSSCRQSIRAARGCLALCAEAAEESLVILADSGDCARAVEPGATMPMTGFVAKACGAARALVCNRPDVGDARVWVPGSHAPLENVLWAPMLVDGRLIGVVGFADKPGGFDDRDAELAQACADVSAMVLLCGRRLSGPRDRLLPAEFRPAALFAESDVVMLGVELATGRILDASPAASAFYGYADDDLMTLTMGALAADEGFSLADRLVQLRAAGRSHLTMRHRLRTGAVRDVEVFPAVLTVGGTDLAYCIVHDITERLEAEAARDERTRFESLLSDLSASFAGAPPDQADRLLREALQRIPEAVGADRVSLYERDSEHSVILTHTCSLPGVPALPNHRITRSEMPWLSECLTAGRPVALPSLDALPPEASTDRSVAAPLWLGSHIFVPLVESGRVTGVLSCGSQRAGAPWHRFALESLSLLGGLFARVLARQRDHQALVERLRFEEVVTNLTTAFASTSPVELEVALNGLLAGMARLLDCDRAVLGRLDPVAGLTTLDQVFAVRPELAPRPGDTAPRDLARWHTRRLLEGEVVAITDLPDGGPSASDAERLWFERYDVGAHLSIPIKVGGQVSHMLGFEVVGRSRVWPEALVRRVSVVADLVGKAIERQQADATTHELRDRLAHVARVMTTGELAAAFAHELNQPLTAIAANTRAAARFLARPDPDLQELQQILADVTSEALRAGAIITHMRDQLRRSEPETVPVDLCDAVSEVVRVLASEALSRDVDLRVVPAPVHVVVAGDRVQLQQIVVNLVMNAFDAVDTQPAAARQVTVACVQDDSTAALTVEDTGHGLPDDHPDSVFDAFVTTKHDGLGLGLRISRSIADAHGGSLHAAPREGGGARFELRLPLLP